MTSTRFYLSVVVVAVCAIDLAASWQVRIPCSATTRPRKNTVDDRLLTALKAVETREKEGATSDVEETTEKYGLEAGLFQAARQGEGGGESAKSLLKKYGVAYLATSIPLAIISFALCYILVDNGVDVSGLLAKVGIEGGDAGEKAGTAAIAYAAHKAASPIRFPPTVLLTPVVAKLIGKEPEIVTEEE
eukprot:CAMPEP_0197434470 /NCGR_PEP_ID=MMETSP1175-20131217/2188_1 /TAXON_ID=1003142 /ORGANISM="Triceratium dubium, Strain CCMP147" /LENGTH=188 /DNA_ID=CAMNT_0042963201 /DNA_START=158 /DNA_END=724 /DNA_ORIENTATION=+